MAAHAKARSCRSSLVQLYAMGAGPAGRSAGLRRSGVLKATGDVYAGYTADFCRLPRVIEPAAGLPRRAPQRSWSRPQPAGRRRPALAPAPAKRGRA